MDYIITISDEQRRNYPAKTLYELCLEWCLDDPLLTAVVLLDAVELALSTARLEKKDV